MSDINKLVFLALENLASPGAGAGGGVGLSGPTSGPSTMVAPIASSHTKSYGNYHHVGPSPFRKVKRAKQQLPHRKIVI